MEAHFIPGDLPALWRQRADFLQQYADPNSAPLWMLAAVELERALESFGAETLTITEAARATPLHFFNSPCGRVGHSQVPSRVVPRSQMSSLTT